MPNYFLLPMNYTEFDFVKLKEEYHNYKEINWKVPGTLNSKREIKKNAVLPNMIKVGDVMYFYVFDIASQSGDNKARVLLRGIVTEEPKPMKYKDIFRSIPTDQLDDEDLNRWGIGFSIGEIRTLNKQDLENDNCFSRELLRTKYSQIHPQGARWPNQKSGNLSSLLIQDLENRFKHSEGKHDFSMLIEHFNRKCFFLGKIGTKNVHQTFKRRNGTDYFEGHHFIQQHSKDKNYELMSIIEAEENLIWLCSNCHNQLHYGRPQDINIMIDELWRDEKISQFLKNEHFSDIIGVNSEEEAKNWVKKVYRSNSGKTKDIR